MPLRNWDEGCTVNLNRQKINSGKGKKDISRPVFVAFSIFVLHSADKCHTYTTASQRQLLLQNCPYGEVHSVKNKVLPIKPKSEPVKTVWVPVNCWCFSSLVR